MKNMLKLLSAIAIVFCAGCDQVNQKAVAAPTNEPARAEAEFVLKTAPGVDASGASEKFKTLMAHCPGIYKYKADLASIEYLSGSHADFLLTVTQKPTVLPFNAYGTGHTCHFNVETSKASVSKRPCAWLCTGDDMTGIDGETHSFAQGKLIGPLVKPWGNLREAIAGTRLEMADVQGEDVSVGAAKLAIWGADNMRWVELQEVPLGKYGLVMKDSNTQRGARLCTSGQVIEIAKDRTVPQDIYLGGMFGSAGNLYRFIALKSTGEIVAKSGARFCGIVTGQQHYPNSIGGVAHAVHLVGMFDLAENK